MSQPFTVWLSPILEDEDVMEGKAFLYWWARVMITVVDFKCHLVGLVSLSKRLVTIFKLKNSFREREKSAACCLRWEWDNETVHFEKTMRERIQFFCLRVQIFIRWWSLCLSLFNPKLDTSSLTVCSCQLSESMTLGVGTFNLVAYLTCNSGY